MSRNIFHLFCDENRLLAMRLEKGSLRHIVIPECSHFCHPRVLQLLSSPSASTFVIPECFYRGYGFTQQSGRGSRPALGGGADWIGHRSGDDHPHRHGDSGFSEKIHSFTRGLRRYREIVSANLARVPVHIFHLNFRAAGTGRELWLQLMNNSSKINIR